MDIIGWNDLLFIMKIGGHHYNLIVLHLCDIIYGICGKLSQKGPKPFIFGNKLYACSEALYGRHGATEHQQR